MAKALPNQALGDILPDAKLESNIGIAKSFFRSGNPYNPPLPPFKKGGKLQGIAEKVPL
jgi:hypothetical protein